MDAIQCLISRRSIREYTDEPISAQEIENVVEIAQMASCWENTQPIRYVAVLDKELKNKIADDCTKKFPWNTENIHAAPALVVLCAIKGLSGFEPDGTPSTTKGTHWQSFDAGVAAAHFCLAANALELIHRLIDLGNFVINCFCKCKFRLRVVQTALVASGNPDSISVVES